MIWRILNKFWRTQKQNNNSIQLDDPKQVEVSSLVAN